MYTTAIPCNDIIDGYFQSIGQNYIRRQEAAKELSSCKELVNRKSVYSDDYSDVYGNDADVYRKDANDSGNILGDNDQLSRLEKNNGLDKDLKEKKHKKKKKKRKSGEIFNF